MRIHGNPIPLYNCCCLLGIIDSGLIWATDLRFLNDTKESLYARDAIMDAISIIRNPFAVEGCSVGEIDREEIHAFERYRGMVLGKLKSADFGVFVTCFCESGDLLSQWRGYGGEHGYAIEVTKESLRTAAADFPTYPPATGLFKVRYGLEELESVTEQIVQVVARRNLSHLAVKAHYSALAVSSMLAQVKHPGFSEEQEWRLIIGLELGKESGVSTPARLTQFRPTVKAIVPYLNIPFPLETIVSVRVGPGENAELRASGIQRLLKALGSNATVSYSEVPFSN